MTMQVLFTELNNNFTVEFSGPRDDFSVSFETFIKGEIYRDYTGAYDVTPMITSQKLETADTHMLKDVLIYTIPTREEGNFSGGVTFILGG